MAGTPDAILSRLEGLGIKLGLDRTRNLLAALGDPQARYPTVLVAGTNGKGSVSALLASFAQAAGYRVGLYTSPHLEAVEERLRIDGRAIESGRLAGLLERLIELAERVERNLPTYFEALTLAAYQWFAEESVDLAVVEVGLGGRLDATNIGDPTLSLVTSIGFDHQEYLGNTLDAIARAKAGIFRPGRPALVWIEDEEPANAVREEAESVGAELHFVQNEVEVKGAESRGWKGARYEIETKKGSYDLEVALLGRHQANNLGLAVRAAETVAEGGLDRINPEAIRKGATACRWPGRLEVVDLPDGRRVLLDAAHNGAGAATLGDFLTEMGEKATFLFGVLADKDVEEMLRHLRPHAEGWVLTTPPSPRAMAPEAVATRVGGASGSAGEDPEPSPLPEKADGPPSLGRPDGRADPAIRSRAPVEIEADPAKALDLALDRSGRLLVACGSIYLLGDLRIALRGRFGVPGRAVEAIF